MDDIELRNIEPNQPLIRTLSRSDSCTQEERIDTEFGTVVVAVQGDKTKPAIITYHDIGLNYVSNFQGFFNYVDTRVLIQSFCVFHVNAPGQEEGAPTLPENFIYPTMDQLAETMLPILKFFGIKHFVGFGVGAGANILSRFALQYPDYIDGLFLINPTSTVSSWMEWGYQKLNAMQLRSSGMTVSAQDYLMWHHFGKLTEERNHDLTQVYRHYFANSINAYNLSLFIDSYIKRTDLCITREMDLEKKKTVKNFTSVETINGSFIKFVCHVLLLVGSLSPHLEDSITMNSRLDPTNSTWMKLSGCGMVLEEEPGKVSEAFKYFLQGLGYALNQFRRKASIVSQLSSEVSPDYKVTQSVQISSEKSGLSETSSKTEVHCVENSINSQDIPC